MSSDATPPDAASPFVAGPPITIAGAPRGPLAGKTFAAKDLFDVAGYPTGGGNPDWPRRRAVPTRHAWAVQRLLDAGATLIGKTVTDEVSLGILGENPFDGTPLNPKAPDRVPGGSSSGSASAVAQGLCDTALGTDTGGSVRVPASFCGLYGIRPTHGRLDLTGMMPQAPSSDTTGWFARDADDLRARLRGACWASRSDPFAARARRGGRRVRPRRRRRPRRRCSRWCSTLAAWSATCARICWLRPGCPRGRGRSARCSPTRPGSPSRTGSIATTRAWRSASPATWRSAARSPRASGNGRR